MRSTSVLTLSVLVLAPGMPAGQAGALDRAPGQSTTLAPFVATPHDVVDRMLRLAEVGPEDVVYDLGSGDGRIVIAAAQTFGARGLGVDIDADLVAAAEMNAKAVGVQDRVEFRVQDLTTVDLSEATVVTLYLLAASNAKLRPKLVAELRPGARIVAHSYPIGDWSPAVVDTFADAAGTTRTLYLWVVTPGAADRPTPSPWPVPRFPR